MCVGRVLGVESGQEGADAARVDPESVTELGFECVTRGRLHEFVEGSKSRDPVEGLLHLLAPLAGGLCGPRDDDAREAAFAVGQGADQLTDA